MKLRRTLPSSEYGLRASGWMEDRIENGHQVLILRTKNTSRCRVRRNLQEFSMNVASSQSNPRLSC